MKPIEITALDTHRLRRAVLRDGRHDAAVVWEGDVEPTWSVVLNFLERVTR